MEIQYHGHSTVQLTNDLHSVIIDPFIRNNSLATTKVEDIKVDYILLTHGHHDHITDALEIALNNDATIVATYELANYFSTKGAKTLGLNIGGTAKLPFGSVKLTQAFHSSSFTDENGQVIYMGMPAGLIVKMGDQTIYHAGDTNLFMDMQLIGSQNELDAAFLPIGDVFTMGPEDAVQAAEWLKAKCIIPIHYNTFPPIVQDGEKFVAELKEKGIVGVALSPGQSFDLK